MCESSEGSFTTRAISLESEKPEPNDGGNIFGKITVGSTTVDVTYTGSYYGFQLNGGTNYWASDPSTYESSTASNAPSNSDIVPLNYGGSKTIAFSQPVQNPLIALVSWNGNNVSFANNPIEFLSYGAGYYGNGYPTLNSTNTGFYGNGELHGVVELPGTFTSITFTDSSEYWHGFSMGIVDLGQTTATPEPTSLLLLGSGPGLVGLVARRKMR